jgi:hypothetical protein
LAVIFRIEDFYLEGQGRLNEKQRHPPADCRAHITWALPNRANIQPFRRSSSTQPST